MERDGTEEGLESGTSPLLLAETSSSESFKPTSNLSLTPLLVFSSFVALWGSFSYGCAVGYSSPAESGIMEDLGLSVAAYSVFGSILTIGGMVGAILSGKMTDLIGRRGTMWICQVVCMAGWLAIAFAKNAWCVDIGRFVVGVAVGILTYVVPVYISEITPKNLRGRFTSASQLLVCCGSAVAFLAGSVVSWRALSLIATIPNIVQFVGLFFVPESPRWLAKRGREKEFEATLQRLSLFTSALPLWYYLAWVYCCIIALAMVADSWFTNWRWNSRKASTETDKEAIGVLAYEVAGLMSKVVNLWNYLSDREIHRLREEIVNSVGAKRLVAEDHDYLMDLALNEILENFRLIAKSVVWLGRKCKDPPFLLFQRFVNDPVGYNLEWFGWQYRLRKMERKVKKMEKFVAATMQLSQELEVLADLEQTLRRLQANADSDRVKLLNFQKRVTLQRQEVRNLREMSPWIRTYDYIVHLLARSLLTILERIKHVFETNQLPSAQGSSNYKQMNPDCLPQTLSFSALMQSSIHPSEDILHGLSSAPTGTSGSTSGQAAEKYKISKKQPQPRKQSSSLHGKQSLSKTKGLSHAGPFKECMMSGSDSPILLTCNSVVGGSLRLTSDYMKKLDLMEKSNMESLSSSSRFYSKLALFNSKQGLLKAPSSTLGAAALALHYANVIILIENLASSSHMIDLETRDDLYRMLPTTVRAALKTRLKACAKSQAPFVYDASLAAEWNLSLSQILEWLSPLAHNMKRWQSKQNFERAQEVSSTDVLLFQTLHFADQAKTEAAITELLVGLNYICRFNGEQDEKASPEFLGCRSSSLYEPKRDHHADYMAQD